jgi:hypothetical protein
MNFPIATKMSLPKIAYLFSVHNIANISLINLLKNSFSFVHAVIQEQNKFQKKFKHLFLFYDLKHAAKMFINAFKVCYILGNLENAHFSLPPLVKSTAKCAYTKII